MTKGPFTCLTVSRIALKIAAVATVLLIIGAVALPHSFLRAYLCAYILWSAVPLGAAAVLATHHLVSGRWGRTLRPSLESAVSTIPLLPVFFLPILIGARWLYPWADPAIVAATPKLQHEHIYLNLPFFIVRAVIYFSVWGIGGFFLARWSSQRDPESKVPSQKLQKLCALGLVVYAVTISFAGIDWLASLQPGWYSSIFGLYILISQALTALALLVVLVVARCGLAAPRPAGSAEGSGEPSAGVPAPILHDFGNLLFMLVILHTYLSFAQFFVIWNGNLNSDNTWYVARERGTWGVLATLIVVTDFVLPFTLLLFRFMKRTPQFLIAIAVIILAARVLEAPWIVLPSFPTVTAGPVVLAAVAMVALGGLWIAAFTRAWSAAPVALIPPSGGLT